MMKQFEQKGPHHNFIYCHTTIVEIRYSKITINALSTYMCPSGVNCNAKVIHILTKYILR